jgi:hypothetical protein
MAYVAKTLAANLADTEISDTDVGTTVQYAFTGSKELVGVYLDNTSGSSDAFLRVFDLTSNVTNGTTAPEFIFYAPGNTARMYSIPLGLSFVNGVAYCGSNTAGTAGTAAPTTTLSLQMLLKT